MKTALKVSHENLGKNYFKKYKKLNAENEVENEILVSNFPLHFLRK